MRDVLIAFGFIASIFGASIASAAPNSNAGLEKYHFPNLEAVDRIVR
jgi:hypothetical protein